MFLLALCNPALASWAITDLAVLEDAAGSQTIASVTQPDRAAAFKSAPHGFSAGFSRSAHWMRFTLPAPPPTHGAGAQSCWRSTHPTWTSCSSTCLGPRPRAPSASSTPATCCPRRPRNTYRAFVFQVDFADARPRTVHVRLRTTSSSVLAVRAWQPRHFVAQAAREYALLGLLLGLFTAALITNLWQSPWRRETIYRRYIAYLLANMANIIGVNGLAAEFLFPQSPFWANHWVSLGTLSVIIFGTRFYMEALDLAHAQAWMRWLYRMQLWVAVLCLPAPFLDFYPEVARVVLPLASLTLLIGAVRSVQLWRQKNANGKLLLLAHLLSLVGSVSVVPTLLGLFPGQLWLIYGFQLGPLGTLVALQLMLSQRTRVMQAQLLQASLDAEIAEATARQERAEREHQRHFLSMLTHELRTPLSVIRMRLGAQEPTLRMQSHARQAVRDIDAIVERCALVSQLEDKATQVQRVPCDIGALVAEVIALQPPGAAGRISLRLAPDAASASLSSDLLLLRTILGNLIDNALKYAPQGAPVRIDVAAAHHGERPGVAIQVSNPPGVAGLPDPARIFEKYYRAPGAHQQSGSGLGLHIAQALAQRLGGSIECHAEPGVVTFVLWLPL
ncbi:sensor histidine kinase [Melaminivora jejuensis]|uniref:sensor histidine kinase n=1 Tax=Melaminivora jejuensis TaxID=1267217 RepID=UPI001ADEC537|nr:sensor histidine kinase [Melaminivora jejuensis]